MKDTLKLTQVLLDKHGFDVKVDDIKEPVVKRLTTRGQITLAKDEESTVVGVISTIGTDVDKDIVLPEGLDLSRYEKNPVVLYQHSMSNPIGKAVQIKVTDDGIIAKTKIASTGFAQDIFTLIKEGVLNTFSIGFIPVKVLWKGTAEYDERVKVLKKDKRIDKKQLEEAERIIEKALLFEYSVVSVPANEDALVQAVSSKSFSDETYEALHIDKPVVEEIVEPEIEAEEKSVEITENQDIENEETKRISESEEPNNIEINTEEIKDTGIKILGRTDEIKVVGKSISEKKTSDIKIIGKDCSDKVSLAYRLLSGKIS